MPPNNRGKTRDEHERQVTEVADQIRSIITSGPKRSGLVVVQALLVMASEVAWVADKHPFNAKKMAAVSNRMMAAFLAGMADQTGVDYGRLEESPDAAE